MRYPKNFLWLIGSTYILLIIGLIILGSLVMVLVLFNYLTSQPDVTTGRSPNRPVVYVTFGPSSSPTANATPVPNQAALSPTDDIVMPDDISTSDNSSVNVVSTSNTSVQSFANTAPASHTQSNTATSTPQATSTATLVANSIIPTGTPTPTATTTPTGTLTPSATPTATPTVVPSDTPAPGRITGRLLLDGAPANNVTLRLEDQPSNSIAETTVAADGIYIFPDLAPSNEGYTIVFAQEWNPQYEIDSVISWGWLGPVKVQNDTNVQMPDLDISLLGFGQTSPVPNASFSAAALTSGNPISFQWAAYPQAVGYWVDLVQEEGQAPIWSSPASATSLAFDGTLSNGGHIQPGEYWWGVGAERQLGSYSLIVYGYLPVLLIEP